MSETTEGPTAGLLDAVCRRVADVVTTSAGPPRRLRLTAGDVSIEVEWADDAAPGPAGPRPALPVASPPPPGDGVTVRAPVVGVFHRAPAPGAAPFVTVGDLVLAGAQLGIVEAMKTMIPVEAPAAGRVLEVLAGEAEAVEYDQALVLLAPAPADGVPAP